MTSKIIPFKGNKPKNKRPFDNLSDEKGSLPDSVEDRIFDLGDEQVDKINQLLETAPDDEVDDFLYAISKQISAIDWRNSANSTFEIAKNIDEEKHVSFLKKQFSFFDYAEKFKQEIIQENYSVEEVKKGEPNYLIASVKTPNEKKIINKYFVLDLFRKLLGTKGITDGLAIAYVDILKYWDAQSFDLLEDNNRKKITKQDLLLALQKRQRDVWEKEAGKKNPQHIIWLFQLLEVKHDEGKNLDGVCNAIIRAVKSATIENIEDSMDTGLWEELESADIKVVYIDEDSAETKNLMIALSEEVYKERKYNQQVAFKFGIFYKYFYAMDEWIEHCYPEFLFPACGGTNYGLSFPDHMFETGKTFLIRNKANEALHCFKRSFMDNIFDHELNLSKEDIDAIIRATRLTGEYKDIIRFLSIFPGLLERGVLPDLRFWGTLEEIRVKLEIEHRTLSTRKIDDFYEIVAKEDYPALLRHLDATEKNANDIILTKDQLKCLIEKIKGEAALSRSLQDLNATADAILREQKILYKKNELIFDALKENKQELLAAINQKADIIIDSLHEINEKNLKGKDLSSYKKYYQDYFTEELWSRLESETQKYFLMAKSLYDSHKWSTTVDEFGFVAIEYAKAIENEFIEKIIKKFIALNEKIELGESTKPLVITRNSKLTFGSICTILNLSKKSPTNDFVKFLKNKTNGGEKILKYKNILFNINENFRNPAAHPYSYNRTKVDEFEKLLFVDQFLRDFMNQIQPVLGENK